MQKPKIVFFGSSKFVIPIIKVLRNNFELSLVITTEHDLNNPIVAYCKKHKLHYYVVLEYRKQREEIVKRIQSTKATLGVLASFGAILPSEILDLFPRGIINVHPSLLPKYRGPTPVQTAILNGEKTTGVTIIKLDSEIDHGPILAQEKEEILPLDTAENLYERLFRTGGEMLPNILTKYLEGSLKPLAQNHNIATFTKHLTRQDGYIEISKVIHSASSGQKSKFDRMIRAYHPWPGVYTKSKINSALQNQKLKIIKFLPDKKIQVEGRKPMSYKDFINGYPEVKQLLEKLLEKT